MTHCTSMNHIPFILTDDPLYLYDAYSFYSNWFAIMPLWCIFLLFQLMSQGASMMHIPFFPTDDPLYFYDAYLFYSNWCPIIPLWCIFLLFQLMSHYTAMMHIPFYSNWCLIIPLWCIFILFQLNFKFLNTFFLLQTHDPDRLIFFFLMFDIF